MIKPKQNALSTKPKINLPRKPSLPVKRNPSAASVVSSQSCLSDRVIYTNNQYQAYLPVTHQPYLSQKSKNDKNYYKSNGNFSYSGPSSQLSRKNNYESVKNTA